MRSLRLKSSICKWISSRSSYYYQATAPKADDKYKDLRACITELFRNNKEVYGYRRIHTLLQRRGIRASENVVRRIMREESLTARPRKKRKYSSYKGEISTAPDNVTGRNFHSGKPNEKWVTDITKKAGLTRSMSAKGCSPDNAACEGFFGHLKTEMFYGHSWDDYSIPEFIHEVDSYIKWYRRDRIKSTLGGLISSK